LVTKGMTVLALMIALHQLTLLGKFSRKLGGGTDDSPGRRFSIPNT